MLSTKDLPQEGGGIPKSIKPGNNTCEIKEVELEKYQFKEGAYHLILFLETAPIEGFEGFFIDKDKPELGRYKGQVGKVRSNEYAYEDRVTKGGRKMFRDKEILKFLRDLCQATGAMKWFDAQDNKHETIERFVAAFAKAKPFKGKSLNWCLGGKEYVGKSGYTNYDLFLPRSADGKVMFELADTDPKVSKLMKFDETAHKRKKKVESVSSFDDKEEEGLKSSSSVDSDFNLD